MSRRLPPSLALHSGRACKPMATIIPDDRWPGMWRISWPDGRLSDMANLSRVKDAAIALCERGPPTRDSRRFDWGKDRRETGLAASPIRQNSSTLSRWPSAGEPRVAASAQKGNQR
jgi:hypothetical protein